MHCRETVLGVLSDGNQHTFLELLEAFQNAEQDEDLIHILVNTPHNKPKVFRDLLCNTLVVMEREGVLILHDDLVEEHIPLFSLKPMILQ